MVKIPGNSHLVCEFTRVTFKVSKGHQKNIKDIPKSSYIIINQQNIPASSKRPKFGNFVGDQPFFSGLVGDRPRGLTVGSLGITDEKRIPSFIHCGCDASSGRDHEAWRSTGFCFFCVTAL